MTLFPYTTLFRSCILGLQFLIQNTQWVSTNVSIENNSMMNKTLSEYLEDNSILNLDYLNLSIENSPIGQTHQLLYVDGCVETGKAIFKIIFSNFYTNNYMLVENYEYAFEFSFRPEIQVEAIDYLVPTISIENLVGLDNMNSISLNSWLNDKDNLETINTILNNSKNNLLNENRDVTLSFVSSSFSTDPSNIEIVISINDKVNETVTITNLISNNVIATNPNVKPTLPTDLSIENIKNGSYNCLEHVNDILEFNQSISPSGNLISVIEANVEETNDPDVVFVNYLFSGVYLETDNENSYVENFVVKVKFEKQLDGTISIVIEY